jgi:ligand-binding SRPBCC domain-containing protein
MRFAIVTEVSANLQKVWDNFNENLFQALAPPFPPIRLLRFDGSLKNDEVHLELNFLLFKQVWISRIIEQTDSNNEIYFVDEGIKLPFFLGYWRHKHLLQATANGTRIIDDITFEAPIKALSWLLFPVLYVQFLYRQPIYKRYFNKKAPRITRSA